MLDPNKVKLAIAPIGWTNDDMPDLGGENTFEQCVSEMALAGFKGSEIGNKYPKDTVVLKHKLPSWWRRKPSPISLWPRSSVSAGSRR